MTALHWVFLTLATAADVWAACHALLTQRDPRAAWGWIAATLLLPGLGPVFYFLFGINRIEARGRKLRRRSPFDLQAPDGRLRPACPISRLPDDLDDLAALTYSITGRSLTGGNALEFLENGEEAYPRMLGAIERAKERVYLSTYIFEANAAGRRFIKALEAAARRGVDVRVLVDGVGEWTQLPLAGTLLKRRNVPLARFLPPRLLPPSMHINLRCHRKILAVDGEIGFTGGMNIGDRYLAGRKWLKTRVTDTHFLLRGPVVAEMEEIFLWDWGFATGADTTPPEHEDILPAGSTVCRCVLDGPNDPGNRLVEVYCAAIASARRHIRIMTPYFLPPREIVAALQLAVKRGVEVAIILPERNDTAVVHWAARHILPHILNLGVRVAYQPPPFAHTKHMIIDESYAVVGSANLDPRSLRLNFEMVLELFAPELAQKLIAHFEKIRHVSRELTHADLADRSLPARLRDAFCWLFSPYL
ncbi:MAG TPA: phospholipase D-like domain-containing protein [Desulfovibrio sp.]|jgi:cardiolipin synthase|uniref:phospholipase D-like domain-containing protein n=1 Tax=Desulfovibrio TaxID=872 RepID=UPI0003FAB139|nr:MULTISPECIES: phospholipase D-like domain-containing protein [Desulfovibrio]MDY0305548.1 phospholipase D-like domain-containing protein [Desulfovibrionaceae bacterium]HMM38740.1 phospholipase D-like domain-containing protein [Desulfovibrio sp.]